MKILIIEDDKSVQLVFARLFERHELIQAYTLQDGIDLAREHRPLLILVDLRLPDSPEPAGTASKIDILKQMIPDASVIVVTGHSTEEIERIVLRAGGLGVASKGAKGGMRGVLDDIHELV